MNDGKNTISNDKRLLELTQKARFDRRNITTAEENELTTAYIRIRNLEEGHVKFDNINLSKSNIFEESINDYYTLKKIVMPNVKELSVIVVLYLIN